MSKPAACTKCNSDQDISIEQDREWTVACGNCYDGDYDSHLDQFVSMSMLGRGRTEAEAVASWNEQCEEREVTK